MKYLLSISLLIVYLVGSIQASWDLADLIWIKDDFTQAHLHFIDQGITQCLPSDHEENILNERNDVGSDAKIIITQKLKVVEIVIDEKMGVEVSCFNKSGIRANISSHYHYDFHSLIFHPPKV